MEYDTGLSSYLIPQSWNNTHHTSGFSGDNLTFPFSIFCTKQKNISDNSDVGHPRYRLKFGTEFEIYGNH